MDEGSRCASAIATIRGVNQAAQVAQSDHHIGHHTRTRDRVQAIRRKTVETMEESPRPLHALSR